MNKIAIHSVPRSGSTWLGTIFNSSPEVIYRYQPLFSYAFKGYLDEHSSRTRINNFFEEIALSNDPFLLQSKDKATGKVPEFKKVDYPSVIAYKEVRYHHVIENLIRQDSELKVVGIIRNPLSVLASWFSAPREFRKDLGWVFEQEWRYAFAKNQNNKEEFYGFEKWKEVAFLFLRLQSEYPKQFFLLKYFDLLIETESVVSDLFTFCGVEFTTQTEAFLRTSRTAHHPDTYAVFKKKDSDDKWKIILPAEIIELVQKDLEQTLLKKFL